MIFFFFFFFAALEGDTESLSYRSVRMSRRGGLRGHISLRACEGPRAKSP